MIVQQKLGVIKCQDSYRDLIMKRLEIVPSSILECPEFCKCPICNKQNNQKKEIKTERIQIERKPSLLIKQPRQRRLSVCGFSDDFLTLCSMLQQQDSVVRPININIIDTAILKDREYYLYVYYDNGLRFVKSKTFFIKEMEKFFIERKIDFEVDQQLYLIKSGVHPEISYKQYEENPVQILNQLKQNLMESMSLNQNLLIAKYYSGESVIIGKFELHQLVVLSKQNSIFNNLKHLQLYLYNEKLGLNSIKENQRNPKDYFIHKYKYIKDNQLFGDIVVEQSYLTDPSIRGEKQWDKEKQQCDKLNLTEYMKYTAHKIAVYIQSFHRLCINEMEIHYVINGPKNISIINIVSVRTSKAEDSQWIIKSGRTLSTAEKIQINGIDLNEIKHPNTERSLNISKKLAVYTKKVKDEINPIITQIQENNKQNTRTEEVFKILNPKVNQSLYDLLEKREYSKILTNFQQKKLRRYSTIDNQSISKVKLDEQQTLRESTIKDYMVKIKLQKKKTIDSPFLRSISKRFFSRRNSAEFC